MIRLSLCILDWNQHVCQLAKHQSEQRRQSGLPEFSHLLCGFCGSTLWLSRKSRLQSTAAMRQPAGRARPAWICCCLIVPSTEPTLFHSQRWVEATMMHSVMDGQARTQKKTLTNPGILGFFFFPPLHQHRCMITILFSQRKTQHMGCSLRVSLYP